MGTSFLKKCMQRELLSSSCRTKSGAPRTSASHLPKLGRSAFCLLSWHMGLIWSCAFGELEYLAFLFLFIWWPGAADTSSSAVLYKHSQPFFSRTTGREGCPVERGGRQGLKKPTSVLREGWQTPSSGSCLGSDSQTLRATAVALCGLWTPLSLLPWGSEAAFPFQQQKPLCGSDRPQRHCGVGPPVLLVGSMLPPGLLWHRAFCSSATQHLQSQCL